MMRRPRFGLLAVLVAMLFAISLGGWWKFHRDLFQEEQALVDALAAAGCRDVTLIRGKLDGERWHPSLHETPRWHDAEIFQRVRYLQVYGKPSDDLRRRAAALPGLQVVLIHHDDGQTGMSAFGAPIQYEAEPVFPPLDDVIGPAAPTFAEPRLDSRQVQGPHPRGAVIAGEERDRLLASVREAWSKPIRAPRRFAMRFENFSEYDDSADYERILLRDGDAYLTINPKAFQDWSKFALSDGIDHYSLEGAGPRWSLARRVVAEAPAEWKLGVYVPRTSLEIDPSFPWTSWTDPATLEHVRSVERLDEDRVLLDFAPHEQSFDDFNGGKMTVEVARLSLILREDLDWTPLSRRYASWSGPSTFARRGLLPTDTDVVAERRGEFVVPIEAAGKGWRTRYAWTIDQSIPSEVFSPDRYLSQPAPPPRELPWLRWYRVTFGLACGLTVFLLVRAILAALRRRRSAAKDSASPAEVP